MSQHPTTPTAPGQTASFALGFIAFCLLVYILQVSAAITIPFVIAVCVWYLLNAMARGVGSLSISGKSLPSFLCFVLAILALVGGFWFTYKLIMVNAADIRHAAPIYQRKFIEFLPQLLVWIPEDYRPAPRDVASFLDVSGFITILIKTFTGIAGKTLVVLFYTGFLLYEQKFFSRKISEMTGDAGTERRVRGVLHSIDASIRKYIWAKTFSSAAVGISTWGVLSLFNIDFAAFWGVMAFVLNFIPYIGTVLAVAFPAIIALVQYGDAMALFKVALALTAIQLFWDAYVYQRIMGDTLNLSPAFTILFVAFWGMIWGVPGLFLALPILAMLVIALGQFGRTRGAAILLSGNGEIKPLEAAP